MLNLFKHQWLPDYIREYILKKFPTKHFKVTFEINGKDIPMDQVVGDERNIKERYIDGKPVDPEEVYQRLLQI